MSVSALTQLRCCASDRGLGTQEFGLQRAETEGENMKAIRWALALLLCAATASALSQESKQPWEETDKLVKSSGAIGALGPTLFGDQASLSNGALSFTATDVSLPGNNALPVAFSRSFTVSHRKGYLNDSAMADWELEVPRITGVFAAGSGGLDSVCAATTAAQGRPSSIRVGNHWFAPEDYWHGNQLIIPGGGSQEMLVATNSGVPRPTTGGPYYWLTADFTYFSCIANGFLALTADGTKYWFDWKASYVEPGIKGPKDCGTCQPPELARWRAVLYATRVEDRFGNWVTYAYTNAAGTPVRLNSITASDGREITLGHNAQGHVTTVFDGSRTWTYQYTYPSADKGTLIAVIQPDNQRWSIDFSAFSTPYHYLHGEPGEPWRDCLNPGEPLPQGPFTGTITHPSGAIGEFSVTVTLFGRTNVPRSCFTGPSVPDDTSDDVSYYPVSWHSFALTKKKVSGPGLVPAEWNYTYFPSYGFAPSSGSSTTDVVGPNNDFSRYTFGSNYRSDEGKLLKVERGSGPTAISKTEASDYVWATSGQPFQTPIGTGPQPRGDGFTSEYLRPQNSTLITQDGTNFSSSVNSFDEFARPLSVTKSSSLGYTRTEATVYHHNLSKWVLSQVETVTKTSPAPSVVMSQTEYDSNALPFKTYSFGTLQNTLTYNLIPGPEAGALSTVKDGNNNTTTLSNWKRGIPQTIVHPATPAAPSGATESAVVHNNGWIMSTTDENGTDYTTNYTYDSMGRLATIAYPIGDSAVWNTTIRSFVPVASSEYGIPAGHWKQTVQTGTGLSTTFYDAQWRPVLTLTEDTANAATKSFVVNRYDSQGHLVFTSYPVASLVTVNDALQGTTTAYDALDRVKEVKQDSELGPLTTKTEYLSGFQTLVTNPRNHPTTTSYQVFDTPSTDAPVNIASPGGVTTTIVRDVFGKPLSTTRTGPGS